MSWFIHQGIDGDIHELVSSYQKTLHALKQKLSTYLPEQDYSDFTSQVSMRINEGVNSELAENIYALNYYYYVLPIANIVHEMSIDIDTVLHHFFRIGEELNIFWLYQLIDQIAIDDNWKRKNKKLLLTTIESHHITALKKFLLSIDKNEETLSIFPSLKHYLDIIGLAKAKPSYHFSMATILAAKLGQLVN